MMTVPSGEAVWLVRASARAPRSLRRQRAHVLARAACVGALLTSAAAALAPTDAPATGAALAPAPAVVSEVSIKDDARLASMLSPRLVAPAATKIAAAARPVDPRFAASPTQARFAKAGEPAV